MGLYAYKEGEGPRGFAGVSPIAPLTVIGNTFQ